MTRAGIALGSNIGDRLAHLVAAQKMIADSVAEPLLASAVYETMPIACEPGAGRFLNAVVEVGCDSDAAALLHELREIEARLGRPSIHPRNVSRTIDLDLLYFGDATISSKDLHVPHPRMHERRFVLQPLADIRADFVLPSQTKTVSQLLAELADTSPVVRAEAQW